MSMKKEKPQGRILVQFFPSLANLASRGLAGWAILIGAAIVAVMAVMTVVAPWISPYNPIAINVGPLLSPPSSEFPLGTNHLGQDMLSRVYSGGAIMFQVAVLSVIVCLAVGVPIGLFASYVGGYTDKAASLVMDSIYAFPGLVLAIAIAAMLGPGVVNMALSIAVVYVPSYFRIIRSQVLTIKELPYVEAAQMMGAKSRNTLFSYILPNVIPSIVAIATINFADAILTAAGLTFVGLGLPVSTPDWGWDLTYGRRLLPSGAWWVIAFPGLMVVLLALGFTLMGEGLSELFNPRLQK
jgi:peptide/nickel transport system permease protein